jgi:hypothetical protein
MRIWKARKKRHLNYRSIYVYICTLLCFKMYEVYDVLFFCFRINWNVQIKNGWPIEKWKGTLNFLYQTNELLCYDHVVITYLRNATRMMRKPNDQMNLSYRETYGWDASSANLDTTRVGWKVWSSTTPHGEIGEGPWLPWSEVKKNAILFFISFERTWCKQLISLGISTTLPADGPCS